MNVGVILYWFVIILGLIYAYIFCFCLYDKNNEKVKSYLILKILMFGLAFIPIFGCAINMIILLANIPPHARIGGIFKFLLKKS